MSFAVLALAACGSSRGEGGTGAGADSSLETDLDPRVIDDERAWEPCGGGIECRQIDVPVDHAAPDGEKLSLSLARSPAWQGYDRRGVILVNPGGPGASGKPFLEAVDARRALGILRGFDIVSFDPRGVGGSGAVPCASRAAPRLAFEAGGTGALIEYYEADARACSERLGPLFDHLGSHDVVHDIELIRQALGQEQLNFLGASYGTRLAALYAETYPERVRAFVLDAPVHPVADLVALVESQFEALISATGELIADCNDGILDCPFDVESLIDELYYRSVELNSEDVFAGFWKSSLTQPTGRQDLADFLYDFAIFPEIWDYFVAEPSSYETPQELAVNQLVHCTDQGVAVPSADDIDVRLTESAQRSPHFAVTTLALATCAGWRVAQNPVERLTAPDAPPLLLIGGEHDILTPFVMAEEMQRSLAHSVLVKSAHYGHGAVLVGLPCIDAMLENFFEALELPEAGASCP